MASTGWQQPLLHSQYILSSSPVAPNVLSPRKWSPTRQPNPNRVTKRPINLLQLAACRHTGSEQPCAHRFQNRGISFENISRAVDRSRAASRRLGAVSGLTTRRCGSLLTAAVSRAPHHSWGEPNRHPVKAPHSQSSRPGTEYLASCFPRSRFSGRPAQETCAEDILPELR